MHRKSNLLPQHPKTVRVGEQFQLVYTLNGRGSNFRGPRFEGFQNLSGPKLFEAVLMFRLLMVV